MNRNKRIWIVIICACVGVVLTITGVLGSGENGNSPYPLLVIFIVLLTSTLIKKPK